MAPVREVIAIFAFVGLATFALTRAQGTSLGEYVQLAVGALFLVTAMRLARREPNGPQRFGIDLAGVLDAPPDDRDPGPLGLLDLGRTLRAALPVAIRECGFALVVAAVVFPPYALGFAWWNEPTLPWTWAPRPDLLSFGLAQLLVVGLPEEALFRGYFQTRLTDRWPATVRIFGAELSMPAWIGQAALFGVLHYVVDLNPERLAVFFPGLLFGWIRARRGGIGAALVFHALSNVYGSILETGWGLVGALP